jgi:diguanylate cyclase (GGDEF)-like protein
MGTEGPFRQPQRSSIALATLDPLPMKEPELPDDEDRRIFALHALQVLDTPPEERFDRLTRLARRAFGMPIALISLVDRERQWFKSVAGADVRETPRSVSFCGHAVLSDNTFVIEDALADARFADNPLVTGPPHVRFYAGQPLVSEEGYKLGTFCIMDKKPRRLSTEDMAMLQDLAALAQDELAVVDLTRLGLRVLKERDRFQRRTMIDPLTGLWSRGGMMELLDAEAGRSTRESTPFAVAFADVDNFKSINDAHGHGIGDAVLHELAGRMRSELRIYDSVGRWGGEEFLMLFPSCDLDGGALVAERVRRRIAAEPVRLGELSIPVTVSIGLAESGGGAAISTLVEAADLAMQRAKEAGKNRIATPLGLLP